MASPQTPHSADNLTWHRHKVTKELREAQNGHKGATLWFTGLSGSGKSTLANEVSAALFERGVQTYVLDGDNIRQGLNKGLTFSPEDRIENIRRIGEVAKLFTDAGIINIAAFISPYRSDRAVARALQPDSFLEIYVEADVATCAARDPKGLYKKALAGEIKGFTGVSADAPYEAPENAELVVDTGRLDLKASVELVLAELEKRGIIRTEVKKGRYVEGGRTARLTMAKPLNGYRLHVKFSDGVEGHILIANRINLGKGMASPLADPEYFNQVAIDDSHVSVFWPNGFDICPDVLHAWAQGLDEPIWSKDMYRDIEVPTDET